MRKRLKNSKRGLTFSLETESREFGIGTKYRYIVDLKKRTVNIIADKEGNMTVSRKRSGKKIKPLFDIRSKEVKELISSADYLEVEILADKIVVYTHAPCNYSKGTIYRHFKSNIVSIEEILGKRSGEIVLEYAAGQNTMTFGHPTLMDESYFNQLCQQIPMYMKKPKIEDVRKVYDVCSLFSGAGLLDYAFKLDPRVRFVYGVDFDKDACDTYRENIGDHIVCKDIREVDEKQVPSCDIIIGGPSCQPYSNANRHNIDSEIGEEKRLLIDDYIRIVKDKQSDVFVIENVPQMLTKSGGMYLNKVINGLAEYIISTTIVEDCEVGGYTRRKRAIIIGSKVGRIDLPTLKVTTMKTVKDALSKVDVTWFNYEDVTKPSPETAMKMSYVPQGGNWRDIPQNLHTLGPNTHSDIYRRLSFDEQAPTITNWRKNNLTHPTENRILNCSEAAALMGLPKEFRFLGKTLNSKQQQIGNGVTQAIGRMVKSTILKALDNHYHANQKIQIASS